jgi:AGCS family alanine or glycine:cation symporter
LLYHLIDEILFTWGLPILLLGVGLVYLIALRAFPYRHPLRTLRVGFGGNLRSGLRSLALALGGTLGVGNITGVALALAAGGAGALFWMWVSAAVAMFLKYGEIVLALVTRRRGADGSYEGGAMFYLKERGGRIGRITAFLFAFLCFLCSLTLGAPVQSNTAAEACRTVLGIPPLVTGLVMLFLTAIAVFGGVKTIGKFSERLIPFMSALYLLLSLYAVLSHVSALPAVFSRVLREAFSLSSGAAGAGGFLLTRAMRYGVTRGLLSNEAGAGTAPMAHAVADNTPVSQGVMGILEVAIDTFVFCTATAIPLLLAFQGGFPALSGIELVMEAFRALVGQAALPLLCVSLFLFAYATVLSWCYYGQRAIGYLTGSGSAGRIYLYLYIFAYKWIKEA